jgi:hypothetical protein
VHEWEIVVLLFIIGSLHEYLLLKTLLRNTLLFFFIFLAIYVQKHKAISKYNLEYFISGRLILACI